MARMNEIDQVIIRYADTLSAEAISYKLGGDLTPIQVKQRLETLLTVPDELSAIQQDQLVTQKMRIIVAELEEKPRTERNAEVILAGLEKIAARLDKRAEFNQQALDRHYAFEAISLVQAVEVALAYLRGLATSGQALTEDQWDRGLEAAMHYARMKINESDPTAVAALAAPEDRSEAA